ncbi:MAG: response regulator [Chloroflexaceae bacterium]|nr:response regulator [Chloroflexaceae bacterium]
MSTTSASPSEPPMELPAAHFPPVKRLSLGIKANAIIVAGLGILLVILLFLINNRIEQLIIQVGQREIDEVITATSIRFAEISQALLEETRLLTTMPGMIKDSRFQPNAFWQSNCLADLYPPIALFDRSGQWVFDLDHTSPSGLTPDAEAALIAEVLQGQERLLAIQNEQTAQLCLVAAAPIRDTATDKVLGGILNARAIDTDMLQSINQAFPHVGMYLVHDDDVLAFAVSERESKSLPAALPPNIGYDPPVSATAEHAYTDHDHADNSISDTFNAHDPAHMDHEAISILLDPEVLAQTSAGQQWITDRAITLHGVPHMYAQIPLIINGKTEASLGLFVGLADIVAFQQQMVINLTMLFIILGLIVMVMMSGAIHYSVVRPLHQLKAAVSRMSEGDYDQRVTINSGDEIGQLGHTVNTMARRLGYMYITLEQQVVERTIQLKQALAEAREARAAAEAANNLKSRFIANMSHELRTPLNSIINFTRIVSSGLRGPVTSEQVDYLNRVHASGEHLLGLINDILDIAKIEAGRMELHKETIVYGEMVRSTLSTAMGLTRDKPIELFHEIAPHIPHIEADHTRVRQILLNLLSNAAKFTDEGSITVRVWQEDQSIITSVSDTGIGIPADQLETIFEEFRQADEGSDRSYQGTGLGLSICQRLVTMHGGRLWVESEVGVGSTFTFSLPINVVATVTTGSEVSSLTIIPEQTTAHLIIVIEDDPSAIEIVANYLQPDGYTIYGVTDSRKALEVIRKAQPIAIILDILMPHRDGWELLVELKEAHDLRHIPVICYTIVDKPALGLSLGASAYLIKPIQKEMLRKTVQSLVGHQGHILVIDDDPAVRDIVPRYLGKNGYSVVTAADGKEGMDKIATSKPDLVILDLMMPVMDGFAVLNALDATPEYRTIPVLVLTARDLTSQERQMLTERVQGLLAKSTYTIEQMFDNVRTILRHSRINRAEKTEELDAD